MAAFRNQITSTARRRVTEIKDLFGHLIKLESFGLYFVYQRIVSFTRKQIFDLRVLLRPNVLILTTCTALASYKIERNGIFDDPVRSFFVH
jgi:nucleoside permease NupC